jgi:hypothetical protein
MAAQLMDNGLGQSWPNAQDVSSSPHWHVYAFKNNGIRYIQVNDLNGNVRVAFAAANGQFLVLPMGRNASNISTPQQSAVISDTAVALSSYTETVYRGGGITLQAVPMSDGTTLFQVVRGTASAQAAPACNPDKEDCNTHLNTLAAPACDPNKEDCNTHRSTTLAAPACDPNKEDCNTHLSTTLAAPSCDPNKEDCNTHRSTMLVAPACDPNKEDCNTHLSTTLAAPACDPNKEDCNTHQQ